MDGRDARAGGLTGRPVTALSVVVVGAGIGGLTAALALSGSGHTVTLIERRTGFSEVGAGLQLSPNASAVLIGLGLGAALRRAGDEPPGVTVRALASGRVIGGIRLGPSLRERHGAPYYVIHRADLQTILLDAVRGRPGIRLCVGREVSDLTETESGVSLTMRSVDGDRSESLSADLVVAADGVRSSLRRRFDARPLRFHRQAAWRAVIPREAAPEGLQGNETGLWLGPRRHVVHYPINGGRRLNIVAIAPEREGDEDWGRLGDPAALRDHFPDAAPALTALLGRPDTWVVWSLVDRPAARPMARGRIALLGDAAHPVLPFLAQGAALAIEDAAVLAASLVTRAGVPEALAAYAASRQPRVRAVQRAARRNGRFYHAGSLVGFARDTVMRQAGPEGMSARYAWVYGWHPPA